jgi:undecaprenyl diphosphate synthase
MMQSDQAPGARRTERLHVAIIMDGNGRWATARGLPRVAGHRAGADAVRQVVEAAPALGVGVLTLFAFSSDNWHRPRGEDFARSDLEAAINDFLRRERRFGRVPAAATGDL